MTWFQKGRVSERALPCPAYAGPRHGARRRTGCRPCRWPCRGTCRRSSNIAGRTRPVEQGIFCRLYGGPVRALDRALRLAGFVRLVRVIIAARIRIVSPAGTVIGISIANAAIYRVSARSTIGTATAQGYQADGSHCCKPCYCFTWFHVSSPPWIWCRRSSVAESPWRPDCPR